MRSAVLAACGDWCAEAGAPAAAGGGRSDRMRAGWGMLFSLGLHVAVVGVFLTVSLAGIRPTLPAPPVVLDVVFGASGGDGTPGDGAPGREGAAGGSAPGPRVEAASAPPKPSPPPAELAKAVAPPSRPAPAVRKRQHPRPRREPSPAAQGLSAVRPEAPATSSRAEAPAGTAVAANGDAAGSGGGGSGGGGGLGSGHGLGGRGDGPGAGGHGGGAFEGEFGSGNGPTFARRVPPEYPTQARRFGREGVVVLRLEIDASGALRKAEVVQKCGAGFDAAALSAVRASSYRPARLHGQAVASRALLRVRFQLSGT